MNTEQLQALATTFELWFVQGDNNYNDYDQLYDACEEFCGKLGFSEYSFDVFALVGQ